MKALKVVLALVLVVAFVACTVKQGQELTGVWQKEDGTGKIEFTKDGKMNVTGPAVISASFKIKDKENLQVDLGLFGTGTLKYALDKDALTITDAKGTVSKYARVKETKEVKKEAPATAQQAAPAPAPAKPAAQPQPEAAAKHK